MKKITLLAFFISTLAISQSKYETDFNKFLNDYEQYFGYLEEREIDLEKIRDFYKPDLKSVKTRNEFISLLENVINEFYNGHISLNTGTRTSNKIIPSGADIYAVKTGKKYFISDLRKDFPSELAGLKKGMEIIKFNNEMISEAIQRFLPNTVDEYNEDMYEYAINMLLAGKRNCERKITVLENGKEYDFFPDKSKFNKYNTLLEFKKMDSGIGYIKINNALGNSELIPEFDRAIDSLFNSETIILDLTETPGGGNTMVARGIMGRFIDKELPYQVHVFNEKPYGTVRKWIELAGPRGNTFEGNLIVMVGHWTGSMGEGMAIGFDAMDRGSVVGAKMAGLIGAIDIFEVPNTKIGYSIPTQKMYHINGTPREKYTPKYLTESIEETYKKALELAQIKK